MKSFFIIKWEIPFSEGIIRYLLGDAGMSVGKLFVLTRFGRRFFVLAGRKQVITSSPFEVRITKPQTADKVKVRAKRRQGVRGTANEKSKKVIALKCFGPFGKTGKFTVEHKDKGTQELGLV